jgi:hypothetical protein
VPEPSRGCVRVPGVKRSRTTTDRWVCPRKTRTTQSNLPRDHTTSCTSSRGRTRRHYRTRFQYSRRCLASSKWPRGERLGRWLSAADGLSKVPSMPETYHFQTSGKSHLASDGTTAIFKDDDLLASGDYLWNIALLVIVLIMVRMGAARVMRSGLCVRISEPDNLALGRLHDMLSGKEGDLESETRIDQHCFDRHIASQFSHTLEYDERPLPPRKSGSARDTFFLVGPSYWCAALLGIGLLITLGAPPAAASNCPAVAPCEMNDVCTNQHVRLCASGENRGKPCSTSDDCGGASCLDAWREYLIDAGGSMDELTVAMQHRR